MVNEKEKRKDEISACRVFFFKQKTAYEIRLSLVGSEMCIGDSAMVPVCHDPACGLRRSTACPAWRDPARARAGSWQGGTGGSAENRGRLGSVRASGILGCVAMHIGAAPRRHQMWAEIVGSLSEKSRTFADAWIPSAGRCNRNGGA